MPDTIVVRSPQPDDGPFRARTTQIQLSSLAARCAPARVLRELPGMPHWTRMRRGRQADLTEIRRWLVNGWSTEHLLRVTGGTLRGDALRNALHWAFPQAYYSAFALALAYFKCIGYTEESHAGVIKKFGLLAIEAKYPDALAFVAVGARPIFFHGLADRRLESPLEFDATDDSVTDAHIRRLLNATRGIDLRERKSVTRLTTAAGRRRRSFRPEDWVGVAAALGPTSLLSFLYRKRIKAHYRDIDTYLQDELDPLTAINDLISILAAINVAHEALIHRALGDADYAGLCEPNPVRSATFVTRRLNLLRALSR